MRHALVVAALLVVGCASQEKATRAPETPEPPRPAPRPAEATAAESEKEFVVQGEMGTLDPAQLDEAFRQKGAEVDACYRAEAEKHAWLGGTLELRIKVQRDGSIGSVMIQKPLGSFDVEHCVINVIQGMRFPPPKGNAEAEFGYPFRFRGRMSLKEWGEAEVGSVFRSPPHRSAIAACGRKHAAPSSPRVALFVVPGGHAPSVGVGGDSPVDEAWARCVVGEVSKWKFDDPRGQVARATLPL